ncbi:hypothetical protein C5Y96_02885 [Blastopirellula marina]|uniref:Uncharacterized protein n=1 Tax=Blastopirellula marina TaxID=124 RepID=A0A2S8G3J7_9BACT|nr:MULTISPECIES: hypothetical protein [Pirellulaceae]PQO38831.1 hypothetical protein C5Y96_02885 [Blastopirellula marina]RCS55139.1 hypothetical protein DTL36_02890 [Bremerella cremea]
MSEELGDQIYDLQMQAYNLPTGDTQLRLYEEALRLAEQTRDLDIIFEARIFVAGAAGFSGHEEKAMAALGWCLATFEKNEDRLQEHAFDLLWAFKNFLSSIGDLPQVSQEQFDQLLAQMESLYKRFGYNMRTVHFVRMYFGIMIGNRAMSMESHAKYVAIPRDEMAHCLACEADAEMSYYSFLGDPKTAIKVVSKILSGKQSCAHIPHRTFSGILRPLAMLQRYDEADNYQKRGYRLIRTNRDFLDLVGEQIAYLLHRGKTVAAIRMFERHLAWGLETHELSARFIFYTASKHLFTALPRRKPTRKLSLPTSFPLYEESSEYDVAQLIDWLERETSSLAVTFDRRNGNDYFSNELPTRLKY